MPKLQIENSILTIQLSKLETFRAGRSVLALEAWRIRSITVVEPEVRADLGRQEVGTGHNTGIYLQRGSRIFVYWPKKTQAVKIDLIDPTYASVYIGSTEAEAMVSRLKAELKGKPAV